MWTLFAIGCEAPSSPAPAPSHKIVLISLDTLRADHLGVYGYSRETSPLIDAFAAESFVFESMLAPAPNTPPSQMSMMTSLYPGRHGFTGDGDTLAPGIETLAERLREEGLRTAGFVDGGFLNSVFGFDRGFETYDHQGGGLAKILPRALNWLDAYAAESFFLFLHTYDIHAPYISPAPYAGMFHEAPYTGDLVPTTKRLDQIFLERIELDPVDLQHLVDSYDEGIRYTDAQIGRLFEELESSGRFEDSWVIVTSDHGEEFGEHGSVIHWQLYYQPNLRIPLIVRPPGGVDGPLRIGGNTELIDILPTLLALVDAEPLDAAQGRSLVQEMAARRKGERAVSFAESSQRIALGWWPRPEEQHLRSIIQGDYQLIFNERYRARPQLFKLSADPMAQHDISEQMPVRVWNMRSRGLLGMSANQPVEAAGGGSDIELAPELREQLEALGYQR
jgi:arylsulfatase A-like enzyme